jgi:hypothetical protein
MHVDLQGVDSDYLARAIIDYAHFQLAREAGPIDFRYYLAFALASGQRANATATYANFHLAALRLASAGQRAADADVKKAYFTRAVLAEAFAAHFLEDAFSAGHITGHWGSHSIRLGTHDAYCDDGVEGQPWLGVLPKPDAQLRFPPYHVRGDAFMSDVDLAHVSRAVSRSLLQVLEAGVDSAAGEKLAATNGAMGTDAYDSCTSTVVAGGLSSLVDSDTFQEVLAETPIPAPREPPLPRVRAEKGMFIGPAVTVEAGYATVVPIGTRDFTDGVNGRFRATGRIGIGEAGIVTDTMNSQAFVDVGIVTEYRDAFAPNPQQIPNNLIGFTLRVRAPGYITLVDGLIAVALAEATENPSLIAWASAASAGGWKHVWKSYRLYRGMTIQFALGRDATFNYFSGPLPDQSRKELAVPAVAARYAFPMVGTGVAQSMDMWIDLGLTSTWTTIHPDATFGGYVSLSLASRLFPPGLLD